MWERQAAPERSSKRRLAWSLLAALLLHVCLAWWFGRVLGDKVAEREKPITVELIEKPRVEPPIFPAPLPPVQSEPRHEHGSRGASPPVKASPPPPGGGQGIEPPGVIVRKPPPGESSPTPSTEPKDVRLFDDHALSESLDDWRKSKGNGQSNGTGTGDRQGTGDENSPEAERARVSARIGRDVADTKAKDRVAVGLIDPYFSRIGGDVREQWAPTPGSLGGEDGTGLGSELKNLGKSWAGANRQYVKTGSPFPEGETPTGLDNSHAYSRPINGTSGFDAADFMARWNAGEFAFSGGLVVVHLTQDGKGKPTEVRVIKSSGFKEFDASAVAAVKTAALSRTAPQHGLGLGGERIESVWKMEARMVSNTCSFVPDPTGAVGVTGGAGFIPTSIACGGTFDPSLHKAEFDRPGKTKIITKVNLVAVYGGETGPVEKIQ